MLKSGPEGAKKPRVDSPCECHYAGTLTDGTEFDSSYKRGEPTTFAPNQVRMMQMMPGAALRDDAGTGHRGMD